MARGLCTVYTSSREPATNLQFLIRLRIRIRLIMLSQHTQIPIIRPQNLGPEICQPSPDLHQRTPQPNLRILRNRPQVRRFQMATDTTQCEHARPRLGQQDDSGKDIDESGRAAAMQVAHVVAEIGGHG